MIAPVLWVLGCATRVVPPNVPAPVDGLLVIAHTNDLHAHFEANRAPWIDGTPDIGGFTEIAAHVAQLHEQKGDDNVLYLVF